MKQWVTDTDVERLAVCVLAICTVVLGMGLFTGGVSVVLVTSSLADPTTTGMIVIGATTVWCGVALFSLGKWWD